MAEESISVKPRTREVAKKKPSRSISFFESIISIVFVLIFLGTPLFFTGVSQQGLVFDKFIFFYIIVLLGMVAWVTKGVITGAMKIRRTPIDIPLFLFWVWYGVTAIFSVDRWHSFFGSFGDPSRGFVALTFFILAFYFVVSHANAARVRRALGGSVIAGAFIVLWTFLAVMDILFLPNSLKQLMPASFMGTFSALTVYFIALVPLFITGIFMRAEEAQKSLWRRLSYYGLWVVLLLTLFLIFTLYSFVSWAALLATMIFFVIYIIAQLVRPSKSVSWIPMVVFVITLGFLMLGQMNIARVTLPVEVSPTTKLSWQVTEKSISKEWFTGSGPANYEYVFSLYKPDAFNQNELYTMRFGQSNSLALEILATTGVLGAFLFIVVWLIFLGSGLYLLTHNAKSTNKIVSLGLWSVVALFFLCSLFVTLGGALLLVFVPLAALAYVVLHVESASEERHLHLSLQASPKYALALAFSFMVVSAGVVYLVIFVGRMYAADMWLARGEKLSATGKQDEAITSFAKAFTFNPNESRYYMRSAQEYMVIANTEARKGEKADEQNITQAIQQSVRAGEVAARLSGNDVVTIESLALIYDNALQYASDADRRTEELYKRAGELEPLNPLYLVKLGELKRTLGDKKNGSDQAALYKESKGYFDQALQKKENLGIAYYQKALVYSRENNLDAAIETMETASQVEPGNISYRYALGVLHDLRNKDNDRDIAVGIYNAILKEYPNTLDVRLTLALLHEKKNDRDAAKKEYEAALDVVGKSSAQNKEALQEQIQKLIDTLQSGGTNISNQARVVEEVSNNDNVSSQINEETSPKTIEGLTEE